MGTYLPERVSFIVVESSLHAHDGDVAEVAEDEPAHMSWDGGRGEVWDGLIWERSRFGQVFRQATCCAILRVKIKTMV